MRVVLDTNTIVSALLIQDSTSHRAFQKVYEQGEIIVSSALIHELADVLGKEKFDPYLTLEERERFLAALVMETTLVEIIEHVKACRDPSDDKILELAANGKANMIISGDKDLLAMTPFREIPIITPAEFLALESPT